MLCKFSFPVLFRFPVLAAAIILAHAGAHAEMQRLRVCIGENTDHCGGTYSDFYKIRKGVKGDVEQLAGNAICALAKGHLLNVDADEAKETHPGDCCGYTVVTIECDIDPVSVMPKSMPPKKSSPKSKAQ